MPGIRSESTADNGNLLFFMDSPKVPKSPRSMSHKDQEVEIMQTCLDESRLIFYSQHESLLVTVLEPSRLTTARDVKEPRQKGLVLGYRW